MCHNTALGGLVGCNPVRITSASGVGWCIFWQEAGGPSWFETDDVFHATLLLDFGNFSGVIMQPCGVRDVSRVEQAERGWRDGKRGVWWVWGLRGVNGRFIYHRCHSLPERKSALPNWNIAEFTLLIRGSACATAGDGRRAARGYHQRERRRLWRRRWHLIGCGLMWQPGFSGGKDRGREREMVSATIVPSGNTRRK